MVAATNFDAALFLRIRFVVVLPCALSFDMPYFNFFGVMFYRVVCGERVCVLDECACARASANSRISGFNETLFFGNLPIHQLCKTLVSWVSSESSKRLKWLRILFFVLLVQNLISAARQMISLFGFDREHTIQSGHIEQVCFLFSLSLYTPQPRHTRIHVRSVQRLWESCDSFLNVKMSRGKNSKLVSALILDNHFGQVNVWGRMNVR